MALVHGIRPDHYRLNREMRLMKESTVDDLYRFMLAIHRSTPIWFFTYDHDAQVTCCAPLMICG